MGHVDKDLDVLIIGGGLAGLNAAIHCQSQGANVKVLESSDRPGGRVASDVNAMKIYVNTYASSDTVLVGYKGSSESDAAAFYCPYIPLMSSGVVLDPSTFEPVVSFMTRYGYVELSNTASSLGNAADYLGTVTIANAVFS